MKNSSKQILVLVVLASLGVISCNNEQEVQEGIRTAACQVLEEQAKSNSDVNELRLKQQIEGCGAGVKKVLKLAKDAIEAKAKPDPDDLFDLGLAWCETEYGGESFEHTDFLLGCTVGITEAPLYQQNIIEVLKSGGYSKRVVKGSVRDLSKSVAVQCLQEGSMQQVILCLKEKDLSQEQMDEMASILRTSQADFVKHSMDLDAQRKKDADEIASLEGQIQSENERRLSWTRSVSDLDGAISDTASYNRHKSDELSRISQAKYDQDNMPGQTTAMAAHAVLLELDTSSKQSTIDSLQSDYNYWSVQSNLALADRDSMQSEVDSAKSRYNRAKNTYDERIRKEREAREAKERAEREAREAAERRRKEAEAEAEKKKNGNSNSGSSKRPGSSGSDSNGSSNSGSSKKPGGGFGSGSGSGSGSNSGSSKRKGGGF